MRALCFYAFLALGLLLDGAQLFRCVLLCAAVHELGHAAAYFLCARQLPQLVFAAGGVCLKRTRLLTRRKQAFVLAAGPAVNFLLAGLLLWRAADRASYAVLFVAAASLCTGLYNLLPVGALDGAQLLELALPTRLLPRFWRAQRVLLGVLCAALPLCAVCCALPMQARLALCLAPGYLLWQQALSSR